MPCAFGARAVASAGIAVMAWGCTPSPPTHPEPPDWTPAPGCYEFVERFQPLFDKIASQRVFSTPSTKLSVVVPSVDTPSLHELEHALAELPPIAADWQDEIATELSKVGCERVATRTALLDAVARADAVPYRRSSTQDLLVQQKLKAVDRHVENLCGRSFGGSRGLPPPVIQAVVRQEYFRFRACYSLGLRNDAKLSGLVAVHFVIRADGSVESAEVGDLPDSPVHGLDPETVPFFASLGLRRPPRAAESPLSDSRVIDCVLRACRSMQFPAPGKTVNVNYPISFEP